MISRWFRILLSDVMFHIHSMVKTPIVMENGSIMENQSWGRIWYKKEYDGWHRDDGPAAEYHDGSTKYYINGKHIPQLDNKRIYGKENLAKFLLLM